MTLTPARAGRYLLAGDLAKLFTEELGWDRHSLRHPVAVAGQTFDLRGLAEKRGVQVLECPPDAHGRIPDYATRRAIEKEVTKAAFEHLIVFVDAGRTSHVWQWVARASGQPAAYREVTWHKGQAPDALVQKLNTITIPLSDDEALDLTGTVHKLRDAFDRDKVTKKFYDQFQREHKTFLGFIDGITDMGDKAWYASLMLNRLMFVYFIQKKGFLDNDEHYLRNRLARIRQQKGTGKFQTFYRAFLRALFHDGFSTQSRPLNPALAALLGSVPYLNGGLFDVHALETGNPKLEIPDEAFARVFAFFDEWDWHLDSRPNRSGREINPDVLGHIFEKYINQKQMGAYYTKEDITDYIGKNTIIPRLFDAAKAGCREAFEPGKALWWLLQENPDRYLYPAVRKGVVDAEGNVIPLPAEIAPGVTDVSQRATWNRPAAAAFALPTETWREHVARRTRCLEVRAILRNGDVQSINDLITFNLDIRQFAADAITNCEGPELVGAFYRAIETVSVLDPTCGSGAFLFAALNILQPLYHGCLDRMTAFVADAEALGKPPTLHKEFRLTLADAARHANRDYFVLKSIIVRNLYGVDIMPEAVEICKLRLFLALVSRVETVDKLEPLPDVDFNIRPGNTLVGFANKDDVQKAFSPTKKTITIDFESEVDEIEKAAMVLNTKFKSFRAAQTRLPNDPDGGLAVDFTKSEIQADLDVLRLRLDRTLAGLYGVDPDKPKKFAAWQASHQPFHWFAEFYGIMAAGGFDVVIGNPPYVEYAKLKDGYKLFGFKTIGCGNIFIYVVERSQAIAKYARFGLILPLSLTCTERMSSGRSLLSTGMSWLPSFDIRPGSLFEGVAQRLTILIHDQTQHATSAKYAGGYRRWAVSERDSLMQLTRYVRIVIADNSGTVCKLNNDIETSLMAKIAGPSLSSANHEKCDPIYVHRICRYYIKALNFVPHFKNADGVVGKSDDYKPFEFGTASTNTIICLLNSTLFYWFWRCFGDGFHCGYGDVYRMPFSTNLDASNPMYVKMANQLMAGFRQHSSIKTIKSQKGSIEYQEFAPSALKPILDDIDRLLAEHYGFTPEELDFILNYDIKYRMGADAASEDE